METEPHYSGRLNICECGKVLERIGEPTKGLPVQVVTVDVPCPHGEPAIHVRPSASRAQRRRILRAIEKGRMPTG